MDITKPLFKCLLLSFLIGLLLSSVLYVNISTVTQEIHYNATDIIVAQHKVSNIVDVNTLEEEYVIKEESTNVLQKHLNTFDPFTIDVPLPLLPNYKNPCFRNEYSKLYCLPYFFFLVSQKSGTTDLFYALTKHAMIVENQKKEYHWWNRGRFPLQIRIPGNLTFSEYMDWYNDTTKKIENSVKKTHDYPSGKYHPKILGDYSASYLYDQLQWKRYSQNAGLTEPKVLSAHAIHYILPDAKFVVILRNPSDRLFSDFCYYKGHKDASFFHTKVTEGIAWFKNCLAKGKGSCLYDVPEYINSTIGWHPDQSWDPVVRLRASLYSEFLTDWFKVFDRKQFYIFRFEDYIKDKLRYLNEIFQFLGLEPMSSFTKTAPKRRTRNKISFPKETRELLNRFYKPYNKKLAKMLKDNRYLWSD